MKNYYKILEVSENATHAEIKKSYRSLAKKYHPDKSSSPSASQLFTEVNEAYAVLSDPEQKRQYDQSRSNPVYQSNRPQRSSSQARRTRPTYRPAYASSKQQVDVTPYIPYFRKISYVAFAISLILSIDYQLPRSIQNEEISGIVQVMRTSRYGRTYVDAIQINTTGGSFRIGPNDYIPILKGQDVLIHRSRLLRLATSVILEKSATQFNMNASIYGNFFFSLIIMLITSGIGSFIKKPEMTILNFGIVNGIMILLVLYFTSVS